MKKIKKLTDEELLKKMEKVDYKIQTYKDLIWFATIIGALLIVSAAISSVLGFSHISKACAVVAGLQSANICLFLGLGYRLVNKESQLAIEHYYRRKKQEELEKKEKQANINFEKTKSNRVESDNEKQNSYDDYIDKL